MKFLISTVILITLLSIFLRLIYANDRKEPDYIFYKADLINFQEHSKILAGTVEIKMDIDHSFIIVNLHNLKLSSTIQSVTIRGPSLAEKLAPVVLNLHKEVAIDQKISINEDQAQDIAHELYYVEIGTKNNPDGELRGRIVSASQYMKQTGVWHINFQKIRQDITRYTTFITSQSHASKPMEMNMKEENEIQPLPENIINQLNHNSPTILAQYVFYKIIPDYKSIAYRPRQFDTELLFESSQSAVTNPGIYKGWDFLNTPNDEKSQSIVTPKWITLHLNRKAYVGVIWRGGQEIPQWLKSWQKSSPVEIDHTSYPVYLKKQSSLKVDLGSTRDSSSAKQTKNYLLIFAEENNKPSQTPITLINFIEATPNSPCPSWVHDQYVTKGPDGTWYATWHPQIDPVYWCYFGHEHGSDPHLFDTKISIPFGYAGVKMGMHEKHVGFKIYIWDDKYGYRFLAVQHQGTSTNQAVCGRYHELDFFVKDKKTDEILAKRYFVGDYGVSRSLVTSKPFLNAKCPDQQSVKSSGARFLPIENERKTTEAWVVDKKNIIGFIFADFVVSTLDSVRLCKDQTCDSIEVTENTGSLREISYVTGLGPYSGVGYSGTFYTGPTGTSLTTSTDPVAVEQYTKPWTSIQSDLPQSIHLYNSTHCYDVEGFGSVFTCGINIQSAPVMRENSISAPN